MLHPLFVIAAAPFVLLIATPIILIRAWILAARKLQRFKFAVTDGYRSVWDGLVAAFLCPFLVTSTGLRPLGENHLMKRCSQRLAGLLKARRMNYEV
jgi:hypothetical protein